ncbi:MAG TPA: efflux RND transporter periplasmic adaptor subunit, partial [Polyangiaceae bacterium]
MLHASAENPIPPSHGAGVPPPSEPAFRFRPTTRVGVVLAVVVSVATIWGSSRFVRKALPAAQVQAGLTIDHGSIGIAPDAPQWQVLELETAKSISSTWTDAVPAFVKVDEAKAARIGVPLAGRVTQVFVELGQPVEKGAPLFAVASPDLAALEVEQSKAKVDVDAAKNVLERTKAIVEA